jgi:putative endonuclease
MKNAKRSKRSVAANHRARKPAPSKIAASRCCCYIVECADGTFYTGWAVDAEERLKAHNSGRGARYTSMRRPVKLVYVEPQPDRTTAMKRERAIKKMTRQKKLALIHGWQVQT